MERFPVRKRFRLPLPVYSQGNAFFITITTHLKHAWFHLHPKLSQTAIQIIRQLASLRHAAVYSWCIMPDHVHLLLQDQEVVDFVRLFTFGKIRCAQQWRTNPKNIPGLVPRSGLIGGGYTGGDKPRPYISQALWQQEWKKAHADMA
jgi:REP element-mobilizing transposase RayT